MIILLAASVLFSCASLAALSYFFADRRNLKLLLADRESEIKWHIERRDSDIAELKREHSAAVEVLKIEHAAALLLAREDVSAAKREAAALLDKALNRAGVGPINQPKESAPSPLRTFVPSSPWEEAQDEWEREDEERVRLLRGVHVAEYTDDELSDIKDRVERAIS